MNHWWTGRYRYIIRSEVKLITKFQIENFNTCGIKIFNVWISGAYIHKKQNHVRTYIQVYLQIIICKHNSQASSIFFRILFRVYFLADLHRFTHLMNILHIPAAEMFHSSQLSLATTTDEGILCFSSNQMSGNGNVSRRSSLFMHKNIFHPVSLGNRSP